MPGTRKTLVTRLCPCPQRAYSLARQEPVYSKGGSNLDLPCSGGTFEMLWDMSLGATSLAQVLSSQRGASDELSLVKF